MNRNTPSRTPLLISLSLVLAGIVIGLIGDVTSGSVFGGVIAAAGIIPAAWAAWGGMQEETSAGLSGAIVLVFLSLGVGGLLLLLAIIDWLRS